MGFPDGQLKQDLALNLIQRWQQEYTEYGEESAIGNGRSYKDQARIAQLERTVVARPWKSFICNAS